VMESTMAPNVADPSSDIAHRPWRPPRVDRSSVMLPPDQGAAVGPTPALIGAEGTLHPLCARNGVERPRTRWRSNRRGSQLFPAHADGDGPSSLRQVGWAGSPSGRNRPRQARPDRWFVDGSAAAVGDGAALRQISLESSS
jgi:hypothetical protein